MIELRPEKWTAAEALITEEIPFVTISMLFQRCREGRLWVDKLDNPGTVIAAFAKDFYAMGVLMEESAQQVLRTIGGTTAETPGLKQALRLAWKSFATTPSIKYRLQGTPPRVSLPTGYRIEVIGPQNISNVLQFWQEDYDDVIGDFVDIPDFLRNGFGACIMHEESSTCVSACAAISVSRERCDYGLDTSPAHEGRGLATACAALAVEQALERGKQPVWITDAGNFASQRVAAKIGFVKEREFEIYKRLYLQR